ncbi:MAG TPA: GT-D fold domain-containing glycosyltransferase [Bacillota bacterium]|nr:GT-D fold domain-containing glycosyltransferase [Bacillota bacterium]
MSKRGESMLIAVNRMHRPEEVLERIRQAINRRQPLSLIRLASGEAFTLAHNSLLPVAKIPWWVVYAGVVLPNEAARRDLIQAVKEGDIVGLSPDRSRWECAPLLEQAFNLYRLRPHYITTAIVNWALHREDALYRLIKDVPTIVIGRRAAEAAPLLRAKGVNVVRTYHLEGYQDLPRCQRQIKSGPFFRVALVAAGIPATILCPRLARERRCIAIDYGHVINDLIDPGFNLDKLDRERERWKRELGLNQPPHVPKVQ